MVTYSIINKLNVGSLIAACVIFFFFTGWFTQGGTRDNSIKEFETSTYLQALSVDWNWYTLFFGVGVLFRGRTFWPHRYASFLMYRCLHLIYYVLHYSFVGYCLNFLKKSSPQWALSWQNVQSLCTSVKQGSPNFPKIWKPP